MPKYHLTIVFALLLPICVKADEGRIQTEGARHKGGRSSTEESEAVQIEPRLGQIQTQLSNACRAAIPAMVRLEPESKPERRQGVIVSPDGLILTYGGADRTRWKGRQSVVLSDGRKTTARPLGWSEEWRIELLQIDDEGEWPFVEFAPPSRAHTGELCLALDYSDSFGLGDDKQPTIRLGSIEQNGPGWFVSSCEFGNLGGHGAGVFNRKGELIGLTTRRKADNLEIQTDVSVIRGLIDPLRQANGEMEVRRLRSASHPEALPPNKQSSLEAAKRASVRIRHASDLRSNFSGTIVNESGLIMSCAHHQIPSGGRVIIEFPDGKDRSGRVLGTNWVTDICLLKLDDEGPWPYVSVGDSFGQAENARLTILGFPHASRSRNPAVKETKVALVEGRSDCYRLYTERGRIQGGMSGGGVFDANGRLVAVHLGRDFQAGFQGRVETFFHQWETLIQVDAGPKGISTEWNELRAAFQPIVDTITPGVVEVWNGKSRLSFGIVVDLNGKVLTTASELKEPITCRLANGTQRAASIAKVSRDYDLALLSIDATNLHAINISHAGQILPGQLVVVPKPNQEKVIGAVAHGVQRVASDDGVLPFLRDAVRDTEDGFELTDDEHVRLMNVPLKTGDEIIGFSDQTLPDLPEWTKRDRISAFKPKGNAGDHVYLRVRRDNRVFAIRFPLLATQYPVLANTNARSSGFPCAFDMALKLSPADCGAPVVDHEGRCIGIVAARRTEGRIFAIPNQALIEFCEAGANTKSDTEEPSP